MQESLGSTGKNYIPRYYEDKGRAHDFLMRCKACQKLVTFEVLTKLGCCDRCGTRKFIEITILSEEELRSIQDGTITFPDSDLFLKEFSPVEGS